MKYIERIEGYLSDELSIEERTSFDKDCETNNELVEELAFYIEAKRVFKEEKRTIFKQRYYKAKEENAIPRIPNRNRLYIRIAASAAAIAILIWFVMPMFNTYQVNNQLAQIEEPIFFIENQTTRSENIAENKLARAFTAVENQDYETVIQLTDSLETLPAIGLKAFAYFELEDYENAAKYYELYVEKETKYFEKLRVQWNLSLAYRKLGDTEKEQKILEAIGEKGREDILKVIK